MKEELIQQMLDKGYNALYITKALQASGMLLHKATKTLRGCLVRLIRYHRSGRHLLVAWYGKQGFPITSQDIEFDMFQDYITICGTYVLSNAELVHFYQWVKDLPNGFKVIANE